MDRTAAASVEIRQVKLKRAGNPRAKCPQGPSRLRRCAPTGRGTTTPTCHLIPSRTWSRRCENLDNPVAGAFSSRANASKTGKVRHRRPHSRVARVFDVTANRKYAFEIRFTDEGHASTATVTLLVGQQNMNVVSGCTCYGRFISLSSQIFRHRNHSYFSFTGNTSSRVIK